MSALASCSWRGSGGRKPRGEFQYAVHLAMQPTHDETLPVVLGQGYTDYAQR